MMEDSISTLSSTPPPKNKIRFTNIIAAHREIERLETRNRELENLLSATVRASATTPIVTATPEATPELTGREKFAASTKILGLDAAALPSATAIKSELKGRAKFSASTKISNH
jgi:hypothetical protein